MRKLLASALMSTISGICFTLAVIGVLLAFDALSSGSGFSQAEIDYIQLPEEVRVVEHETVLGTPNLTIRGVIENFGKEEWLDVSVHAAVFAGEAQVNSCDRNIGGKLGPGKRAAFQIECYGISGSNLPENISYKLSVRHARIKAG